MESAFDRWREQEINRSLVLMICCPLCDYMTGIATRLPFGIDNARGALVSHLCRKRHSKSRQEARALAKQQPAMLVDYNFTTCTYCRGSVREKEQP